MYCSITGFGQTGPRKEEAGYDFMIQGLTLIFNIHNSSTLFCFDNVLFCMNKAMGGLMSLTGEPGRPQKVGMAVVDILTGMYSTVGILASLLDKRNRGRHIDVALFDTQVL